QLVHPATRRVARLARPEKVSGGGVFGKVFRLNGSSRGTRLTTHSPSDTLSCASCGGLPRLAARVLLFLAASCLEGSHAHLPLFPGRGAQFIARLLNLGPILLPDVRELGLLLVGKIQVLEVCNPMGHPVAHLLLALVLQLLELFLLPGGEHVPNLL